MNSLFIVCIQTKNHNNYPHLTFMAGISDVVYQYQMLVLCSNIIAVGVVEWVWVSRHVCCEHCAQNIKGQVAARSLVIPERLCRPSSASTLAEAFLEAETRMVDVVRDGFVTRWVVAGAASCRIHASPHWCRTVRAT